MEALQFLRLQGILNKKGKTVFLFIGKKWELIAQNGQNWDIRVKSNLLPS